MKIIEKSEAKKVDEFQGMFYWIQHDKLISQNDMGDAEWGISCIKIYTIK